MVVFHMDMVNCLSPRVLEPNRGEEAQGEMPTMPAFCASRLAGPPKSKSLGVMMALAPFLISSTATLPTVTGSLLPSRLTNSSWRPSTPPFLLISSTASCAPRTDGSSRGAWMPVRHRAPPIRIFPSLPAPPLAPPARARLRITASRITPDHFSFLDIYPPPPSVSARMVVRLRMNSQHPRGKPLGEAQGQGQAEERGC